MAKRSAWVWVGVAAGVAFLLFSLCVCSIFGYAYFSSQRTAEAKRRAERARPLIGEADLVLKDLQAMDSLPPSNASADKSALARAADLGRTRERLTEAKTYLKEADDAGASGDMAKYVTAALAATDLKLELVELRERQKTELAKATKAAASARSAFSLMNSGTAAVDKGVPLRNADQYAKADATRRKGARMLLQALSLYKAAQRAYPAARFGAPIAYLLKTRVVERYEAKLDSMGKSGRISEYNRVVPKANTSRRAANKLWSGASSSGGPHVVDVAYNKAIADLLSSLDRQSKAAAARDVEAESAWQSLGQ